MNITLEPIQNKNMNLNDDFKESYGNYEIRISETGFVEHYRSKVINKTLCIIYGSIYTNFDSDTIDLIHSIIHSDEKKIYSVDGSFLYFEISSNGKLTVFSEREGMIPIYYRVMDERIVISTRCECLFNDYSEEVIDYSALYDYLRYGLLIGNHTFSTQVKLLQGGSRLFWGGTKVDIKKLHFFHHDSANEETNISVLFEQLNAAYINAIRKRIDRPVDEISVFLSGGMDSRLLIAALNSCSDEGKRATGVSFGMPKSEEVDIARKVTYIGNNPFMNIELAPKDHLSNAEQYVSMTCGSDMFVQSYIIDAAKQIRKKGITAFMVGRGTEEYIGGTFLPDSAIETNECLSDFLPRNMRLVKCELFSEDELHEILLPNVFQTFFKGKTDNLIDEAKKYDDFPVKDVIQSFIQDNRAKRLVSNRDIIPGQYLDWINPNCDIDFLKLAAKIPAKERRKRKFYREFLINQYPQYADIVYNNTTLPVSAPLDCWEKGSSIEQEREKLFSEIQKACSSENNHTYYPHYYSDFDGYSRYDSSWIKLFHDVIFSKNTFLIGRLISRDAVIDMLNSHLNNEANYRKKLINLVSLEMFFMTMLKK